MKKVFKLLFLISLTPFILNAQNLRIEVEQLVKELDSIKIIDVRDNKKFYKGHIKGALNFPVRLSYYNQNIDGKIITPHRMQTISRNLGIDVDDQIVVYDGGVFFDAARLFWTLEVYGFKNVKILNAGYEEWSSKKLPITKELKNIKPSNYVAQVNNKRISTKFTTQIATRSPNQVIIDARHYNAYIGKESSAKRFGHIPKAIHIPAVHNLNKEEREIKLKDSNQLKKLYKNISKNKKVVIYCAIGRIASTNYFALRELGYNVSNYDASWKEWGNDFNLPIINQSKKIF